MWPPNSKYLYKTAYTQHFNTIFVTKLRALVSKVNNVKKEIFAEGTSTFFISTHSLSWRPNSRGRLRLQFLLDLVKLAEQAKMNNGKLSRSAGLKSSWVKHESKYPIKV